MLEYFDEVVAYMSARGYEFLSWLQAFKLVSVVSNHEVSWAQALNAWEVWGDRHELDKFIDDNLKEELGVTWLDPWTPGEDDISYNEYEMDEELE